MKKILKKLTADLDRYFPVGYNWERELDWLTAGFTCSTIYALILYSVRYSTALESLYQDPEKKIFYTGAVMADFSQLARGCMLGFLIIIAATVFCVITHYNYHYQGSKSIYLMKRLPAHNELWRRCLIAPIITAILAVIASLLLTLLLFGMYHLTVPEEISSPGQWQKFWRDFL